MEISLVFLVKSADSIILCNYVVILYAILPWYIVSYVNLIIIQLFAMTAKMHSCILISIFIFVLEKS